MTTVQGGVNITNLFDRALETVTARGREMSDKMDNMKELSNEDMLKMQFALGQYNTLIEATSSVTKSLVDEAKNVAQRAG